MLDEELLVLLELDLGLARPADALGTACAAFAFAEALLASSSGMRPAASNSASVGTANGAGVVIFCAVISAWEGRPSNCKERLPKWCLCLSCSAAVLHQ